MTRIYAKIQAKTEARRPQQQLPAPEVRTEQPPSEAQLDHVARKGHDLAHVVPDAKDLRPQDSARPVPQPLRAHMEDTFGADFSAVRIHEGPDAGEIGTRAYTRGEQITFAPDQYDPDSPTGRHILAHELAHVVQQRSGRARPAAGGPLNADAALEAEADAMGARAARGEAISMPGAAPGQHAPAAPGTVVQGFPGGGKDEEEKKKGTLVAEPTTWHPLMDEPEPEATPAGPAPLVPVPAAEHPLMQPEEEEAIAPAPPAIPAEDRFLAAQKAKRMDEVQSLAKGQVDRSYKGQGAYGQLRRVIEDPRLPYEVERESDRGNWIARKLKRAKEVAGGKLHEAAVTVGASEPKPGEDFETRYERRNETTGQKAKRYAAQAAEFGADYVPVVGTVKKASETYLEHKKKQVAEEVASDPSMDPVHSQMASGVAKGHKKARDEKIIESVVEFGGSLIPEPTSRLASQAVSGATTALTKGITMAKEAIEERGSDPRARRLEATTPASSETEVDRANQALANLQEEDPEFGQAVLGHLMQPEYDVKREIALNRDLQKSREQGLPKTGVVAEPTLAPSQVYNQARREDARMQLRKGFGKQFEKLETSEKRTWVDPLRDAATFAESSARSLAQRVRGSREPEEIEMEELDEFGKKKRGGGQ